MATRLQNFTDRHTRSYIYLHWLLLRFANHPPRLMASHTSSHHLLLFLNSGSTIFRVPSDATHTHSYKRPPPSFMQSYSTQGRSTVRLLLVRAAPKLEYRDSTTVVTYTRIIESGTRARLLPVYCSRMLSILYYCSSMKHCCGKKNGCSGLYCCSVASKFFFHHTPVFSTFPESCTVLYLKHVRVRPFTASFIILHEELDWPAALSAALRGMSSDLGRDYIRCY